MAAVIGVRGHGRDGGGGEHPLSRQAREVLEVVRVMRHWGYPQSLQRLLSPPQRYGYLPRRGTRALVDHSHRG